MQMAESPFEAKAARGGRRPLAQTGCLSCLDSRMNPFSLWTEFAFKLWGFGKAPARPDSSEKPVAVAVIPTADAQSPPAAKAAPAHHSPKRAKAKVRLKRKGKRARR
jgi:hypothetical protein